MTPLARLALAVIPAVPPATKSGLAPAKRRDRIPPGCRRVEIGWTHPKTEEDFRVVGYLTPGRPERGPSYACAGEPAESPEFCPLTVVEDRPGGVERPELLDLVERDLNDLTMSAEEVAVDRAAAAEEDEGDRRCDEMREGEV